MASGDLILSGSPNGKDFAQRSSAPQLSAGHFLLLLHLLPYFITLSSTHIASTVNGSLEFQHSWHWVQPLPHSSRDLVGPPIMSSPSSASLTES